MPQGFSVFIALRYLRTKRKERVISVITAISIVGVAAGVMALVIALAINNGFSNTLQGSLLGATAHVTLIEKTPGYGIEEWRQIVERSRGINGVTSVEPTLYGQVFLAGPVRAHGSVLKGIRVEPDAPLPDFLEKMQQGSVDGLRDGTEGGVPGIVLGSRLARSTGMVLNSVVKVISPQGEVTPFGPVPSYYTFRVTGTFESGFFDVDSSWAFVSLEQAQRVLSLDDVVNAIEFKITDLYQAPAIAAQAEKLANDKELASTHWQEQNRQILNALKMEKVVTAITIGLIVLVAALNILITLVMMVMEKYRDIGILMSMGATGSQIRRIFVLQGLAIGAAGTVVGLILGYTISYFADKYRWIQLDAQVYALSWVPFEPRWVDALWISAAALAVSYLATIYPARNASRIAPVEAVRYE